MVTVRVGGKSQTKSKIVLIKQKHSSIWKKEKEKKIAIFKEALSPTKIIENKVVVK